MPDPAPTFSVIIPCYKQASYLKTSIASALAQAGDVQVIVVDDGSPDDTAAQAGAFGDRVLLIRQANAGVAAARNAGLARATGDFVSFLDADDYLLPDMLAAHAAELTASSADVSACGWQTVDPAGSVLQEFPAPVLKPDPFHALVPGNLCPPVCYVFRRSVLNQVNGLDIDRRKGGHADWDLLLRLAARGATFVSVPQTLVGYRVHPTSMSANLLGMFDSAMAVLGKISAQHGRCPQCGDTFRDAYQSLYEVYANFVVRRIFARGVGLQSRLQLARHLITRSIGHPGLVTRSARLITAALKRKVIPSNAFPSGERA